MQTELNELAARITTLSPTRSCHGHRAPSTGQSGQPGHPAGGTAAAGTGSGHPKAHGHAGQPAAEPAGKPAGRPAARPAEGPTARPAGGLLHRPAPAARRRWKAWGTARASPSSGQGRQLAAMRFAAIATSVLFLFAVAAGVVEVHLHGFDFFVFRATGIGETGQNGLQENQGPGQPDAPKPTPSHIKVQPSPHSTGHRHNG